MSGSCCSGAAKSGHTKVVIAPELTTTEVDTAQQAAKSECCNDKSSAKSEKRGCGC